MQRIILKSKIHRATVTDKNINYEGSIAIDKKLIKEADLLPFEQVSIYNVNNGQRFETYIIEAPENSGTVSINGAAGRLAEIGDIIIIASYGIFSDEEIKNFSSVQVYVENNNSIKEIKKIKAIS